MLTRSQIILLKRAQAQAGVKDDEYRESLVNLVGVRSSKDPALGDDGLDILLAFFESIYWRAVDSGELQASCKPDAPYRQRGFWAARNRSGQTSRDRYALAAINADINRLHVQLSRLGISDEYCTAIYNRIVGATGSPTLKALVNYRAALHRLAK